MPYKIRILQQNVVMRMFGTGDRAQQDTHGTQMADTLGLARRCRRLVGLGSDI